MKFVVATALVAATVATAASGKGGMPEDYLKGQIIISDKKLPTRWTSVPSYVSQLKGLNKGTLWYDKKTNKLKVEYAAFFAEPLNDVQVDLAIYDVTGGRKERKAQTEQFMNRGDRVLFNSVVFDSEDFEMNKKYMLVILSRGRTLASGSFILRGEGPHYSGKVSFTEEETRQ